MPCGCLGCSGPRDVRIDHPDHGELVVCEGCADDYPVVGVVA